MGLDMYAYRFKKLNLQERVYEEQELFDMGYSFIAMSDVEGNEDMYKAILPYAQVLNVECKLIDMEAIRKDYQFDGLPDIGAYSNRGIRVFGTSSGQEKIEFIDRAKLEERYRLAKVMPCLVLWKEEVAYWRKEYEISDFFDDRIGHIANTGYYLIPREVQSEYNRLFAKDDEQPRLPEEDETDKTAIVYWEWY